MAPLLVGGDRNRIGRGHDRVCAFTRGDCSWKERRAGGDLRAAWQPLCCKGATSTRAQAARAARTSPPTRLGARTSASLRAHVATRPPTLHSCRFQRVCGARSDHVVTAPPLSAARFAQVIFRKDTHKLIAVHIIGLHAADLIQECANAIEHGVTLDELAMTTHTHPTLCEVLDEAFKAGLGRAAH
eukprot:5030856-Pleurochrysis_carterae.AAC.2